MRFAEKNGKKNVILRKILAKERRMKHVTIFFLKIISRIRTYYKYYITLSIDREQSFRWLKYPQTWNMMPKEWKETKELYPNGNKKLIRKHPRSIKFLEWLCGVLTGHEISNTERGYGGGKFYDYHCRWCDKLIQIPTSEMPSDDWMRDMYDNFPESE